MTGNNEEEKVRVRFVTQVEKFRVTETPFLIPVALGRQGLSEVISHLLHGETSSKKSESKMLFDFMVQGILIRTPLSKLLARFQYKGTISSEDILTIEYFPATAIDKNNPKDPIEIPAWVGCITTAQIRNPSEIADLAIAGCYDGHVQVINVGYMLGEKLSLADSDGGGNNRLDFEAHSEPVRAVCSWVPTTSSQSFAVQESSGRGRKKAPAAAAATTLSSASVTVCIATGSKDHSIKLWRGQYSPSTLSFQPPQLVASLPGISSVESLTMVTLPQQQRIMLFGGDWNGCLRGWKLPVDLNLEDHNSILDDDASADGQQKRRKTGTSDAQSSSLPKESFCIKAHTQTLAGVDADAVGEAGQQLLWTCSWDRSLKLWDIERQDCVACFVCPKVATSVQRRGSAGIGNDAGAGASREVVATSHTDGKVRLWDSRIGGAAAEDRSVPVSTFGRDSQWISQVRWRPGSEFLFAASDYSGAVCLWDTRATTSPLSSSSAHEGKALCLDWISASSSRISSSNNSNSDSSGSSSSAAAVEGNRRQRRSESAKEVPQSSTGPSQWAILSGGSDSKMAISPINSF